MERVGIEPRCANNVPEVYASFLTPISGTRPVWFAYRPAGCLSRQLSPAGRRHLWSLATRLAIGTSLHGAILSSFHKPLHSQGNSLFQINKPTISNNIFARGIFQ